MNEAPIVIIGAGIGGLVSAALLSARGVPVVVCEKEDSPGGKVRQVGVDGAGIDAGPTVFTMRDVFEDIFARAGSDLQDHVELERADILARHAWDRDGYLDLHADMEESIDAIGAFAGAKAAAGYRSFAAEAKRIHDILDESMLRNSKVSWPLPLMWRIGLWRFGDLVAIRPYESLWKVLGEHFEDPRLRQLFGRYTTYCGSSPFRTPATLMLIAHVEAMGVWKIRGGMSALAKALETVARSNGAQFRYRHAVQRIDVQGMKARGILLDNGERIAARSVICNADPSALGSGLFGVEASKAVSQTPSHKRSLSAMVWLAHVRTSGFPLEHHNVFFSGDYPAEFSDIAAGNLPQGPTAYVCRLDDKALDERQRLQVIVNAPANGDTHQYSDEEKAQCTSNMLQTLKGCGLALEQDFPHQLLTPNDFSARFPATGGAIYGRASHGWAASFLRPGSRTRIRGLYCAGGATHPGAGVPMAALSGHLASKAVLSDLASTRWFHRKATAGGMSMRSAITSNMG